MTISSERPIALILSALVLTAASGCAPGWSPPDRGAPVAAADAAVEPAAGPVDVAETPRLVPLERPDAAQTLVVTPAGDEIYEIVAAPEDAAIDFEAKDLVLRFPDDGRIVFRRMLVLAEAGEAPLLRVGETDIDGDAILGQAMLRTASYPPMITGEVTDPVVAEATDGAGPAPGIEGSIEASAAPTQPDLPREDREVFYATDRMAEGFGAADYAFAAEGAPEGRLSFGRLTVAAPGDLPEAEGGAPTIAWSHLRPDEIPPGEAVLLRIDPLWRSTFQDRLGDAAAATGGRGVLVFVHGPGISFSEAAGQIVELAHALDFDGTLVLYSWPAEGGDSGNALIGRNLDSLLATVRAQTGATAVHLVVHPALEGAVEPSLGPPEVAGAAVPDDTALYWRFGA